jgi:predicted pyridoxine 5'-phosphate oxidase superfamily flavin-nucleotide-binding protein
VIPPEAKASMQGAVPSVLTTCSAEGVPNVTHISQVWYVDDKHIALSFQFFNKTAKNVRANPYAHIRTLDPGTGDRWLLDAKFVRSETEGDTFEEMEMQLEAIASMSGMEDVFHLKAADIYEVWRIQRVPFVPKD